MTGNQPLIINDGLIQAAGFSRVEIPRLNLGDLVAIQVTSNSVTISRSLHFLVSNTFFPSNVDNIFGGAQGDLLLLGGSNVRLRTNGNLSLSNNFILQPGRAIVLLFVGSSWFELSRTS